MQKVSARPGTMKRIPYMFLHRQIVEETQALSLINICMVDGSWTSTNQFSGIGWVCKDRMGKIQLMGTRNIRRRETALHLELEALRWAIESMLQHSDCQGFGTECKDMIAMVKDPQAWPNFSTELEVIQILKMCSPDFKISYFPRTHTEIVDSLARNARSFHRSLCYIGCSIPVWLPRTPQV
uniref:RNase H type-1 domain-containing protein n=1 Tax=Brassica oleracea var. oleracea TaxID=109376 RepID=A0A0D3AS90_BRAOL